VGLGRMGSRRERRSLCSNTGPGGSGHTVVTLTGQFFNHASLSFRHPTIAAAIWVVFGVLTAIEACGVVAVDDGVSEHDLMRAVGITLELNVSSTHFVLEDEVGSE